MSTYKELWEEFQRKVKELQKKCDHPKTLWVIGTITHPAGFAVKVCKICNKDLKKIPIEEAYDKGYLKKW